MRMRLKYSNFNLNVLLMMIGKLKWKFTLKICVTNFHLQMIDLNLLRDVTFLEKQWNLFGKGGVRTT